MSQQTVVAPKSFRRGSPNGMSKETCRYIGTLGRVMDDFPASSPLFRRNLKVPNRTC
jgi:hypothetical protein